MVMLAAPLAQAIAAARAAQRAAGVAATRVLHLSPAGMPLTHAGVAAMVAAAPATGYVFVASRYEGVDERLLQQAVDEEVAVGDFVVSGGELPALMVIDALARLIPGALNDEQSAREDSFAAGLLDCPHYTRPEVYESMAVPEVLLSGHHAQIRRWRLKQALGRTWRRRPDLLETRVLDREESALLAEYAAEEAKRREP
jgi:tRNA (guanine37-N1)-methyltransferase